MARLRFIWGLAILLLLTLFIKLEVYLHSGQNKLFFYKTKQLSGKFVILSSSVKSRYLFLLPITVATWKKLDVQPIVILIKDKSEKNSELKIKSTIDLLEEMNVLIIYVKARKLSSSSLSQIIRLFGPVIPDLSNVFDNENILITSDADLAVFNLTNHIPDIENGKTLHLYNANCCEPITIPPKRGNYRVKQYTMITIGATIKTWKNIMGFNKRFYSINEIENYIIQEFGENFFQNSNDLGSPLWYADQSLISYKIDEWRKRSNNEKYLFEHIAAPRRIDRMQWPTPKEFSQINLNNLDDCHQPTSAYAKNEWEKYIPFLKLVFRNNILLLKRFLKYRETFCENS